MDFRLKSGPDSAHRADRDRDFAAIFLVTIIDQESRAELKRERFPQLLDDPGARRMARDIDVQDLPPVMTDHEEAVE